MTITKYLFVDLSYYIFYRFHSTWTWFSLKHKDEYPDLLQINPYENEIFREKFRSLFVSKLQELPYALGILEKKRKQRKTKVIEEKEDTTKMKVYISKDCMREDIWRTKLFPEYKANRIYVKDDPKNPSSFFKMVYQEELYKQAFPDSVLLEHPHLEADDCIALMIKHLVKEEGEPDITVVTSDMDYLQLMTIPTIKIYTLQEKPLKTEKSSLGDASMDLEMKICVGDTSDNISSLKYRYGKKKYMELLKDRAKFEEFLDTYELREKYELNKTLVSFERIPFQLQNDFYEKYIEFKNKT